MSSGALELCSRHVTCFSDGTTQQTWLRYFCSTKHGDSTLSAVRHVTCRLRSDRLQHMLLPDGRTVQVHAVQITLVQSKITTQVCCNAAGVHCMRAACFGLYLARRQAGQYST